MDSATLDRGYLVGHAYGPIYNKHFSKINFKNMSKILEIGVSTHGSQTFWKKYLPKVKYFGLDNRDLKHLEANDINIFQGDQKNRNDLQQLVNSYGSNFDIIVDDGGHHMDEQQISLGFLFQHLKPGGIYVCEDLFSSWDSFKFPAVPWVKSYYRPNKSVPTSLQIFKQLENNEPISSHYMSKEEADYLNKYVASCKIEIGRMSEIVFIKKSL